MTNLRLPTETLDHVVDFLRDTECALRNCCLVSKSWIPRSRKHIFASITFLNQKELGSWKTAFPDPSTSPANYTKTLFVDCLRVAVADGWIRCFSRVVHLKVVALGLGCTLASRQALPFYSTCHRLLLHESPQTSVFADFRPRPFVPTSRGPDCGHRQSVCRR